MVQIEPRSVATVPKLHGRLEDGHRWRDFLGWLAERGAIALVVAGLAATLAWVAALGWSVLALVRWAIG
ncbi:hypothetical protein [Enterovirga aerilata]|uniref:Uncharacterized protein n=1 Tax=Enterovirga aerilata TaxID=2730920 RepID=A0A849IGJ8_9HYPH|nr:hypothetical protein [Enterovirga sp. DB1703]NNM73043.1 hypothetical protein [Enterovirga sp. DB1703]